MRRSGARCLQASAVLMFVTVVAPLAKLTGTTERYIREWLRNQAAGGYVIYNPATDEYTLPAEQAFERQHGPVAQLD